MIALLVYPFRQRARRARMCKLIESYNGYAGVA